jgi:polyhydroxyalkanoate synthesis regulator phasin
MAHAGPADAQELWEELERRWSDLASHAKLMTRRTEDALDGVTDGLRENVTELRAGYERLASTLREPRSDSLWSQLRKTLDRLVEGGHRTTERVAGSVEDLTDAAKVRMRKANLERTRFTKCAELGTRVYELANEPARPEAGAPQVLDDDQVTALLQDLGSLDVDLRKAASEILEPDRIEA